MASSYVEVRDSENGTGAGLLQFDIESNGLDLPAHVDTDPPKDHTYTKDPDVVGILDEDAADSNVRKSSRSTKGNRTKANKKAAAVKPAPKRANTKKVSPVKEIVADIVIEEVQINNEVDVNPVAKEEDVNAVAKEDVENVAPPQNPPSKRGGRKRKAEPKVEPEVVEEKKKVETQEEKVEPSIEQPPEPVKEEEPKTNVDNPKKRKIQKRVKKKVLPKKKVVVTPIAAPKSQPAPATPPKKKANAGSSEPSLPAGWTRKVVERKSGKTAGHFDIYIYSPEGVKLRSMPDVAAYLRKTKSKLKLDQFSFTKKGLQDSGVAVVPARVRGGGKPEPKAAPKKASTPSKKATVSTVNSGGKKRQKLVVKFNPPKRRGGNIKNANAGTPATAQQTTNRRQRK